MSALTKYTSIDLGAPKGAAAGDPTQNVKRLGRAGDQLRASVLEWPLLIVSIAYLYRKTFIDGNPNRSADWTDIIPIVIVAYGLKRAAVGARWRGVMS